MKTGNQHSKSSRMSRTPDGENTTAKYLIPYRISNYTYAHDFIRSLNKYNVYLRRFS